MSIKTGAHAAIVGPLLAASLALSGCVSSPTYGTDKTATEQLVGDVSNILSVAPKRGEPIDYKPRPELVKPADTAVLPPPQDSVITAANEQWPVSPEDQRAQLRAEATANRDKPGYKPRIVNDVDGAPAGQQLFAARNAHEGDSGAGESTSLKAERNDTDLEGVESAQPTTGFGQSPQSAESGISAPVDSRRQREEFNRRLAENRQGSATSRKYLSEPPLVYREPAPTAPVDDIGEDEYKKELRRKAEARKAAGKSSWRDFVPGF